MLKNPIATAAAVIAPATAHQCGLTFRPTSRPNRTRMGRVATRVESHQRPKGS